MFLSSLFIICLSGTILVSLSVSAVDLSDSRQLPEYDDPLWNFPFGDDISGPYCANRRGERCCAGRNDRCGVPILDTMCYCDQFCNRSSVDCCPDYADHCLGLAGLAGPLTRPTALPLIGEKTRVINKCLYADASYEKGDIIRKNCNNCTCIAVPKPQLNQLELTWQCTDVPCLIEPLILTEIQLKNPGWQAANYSFMWGQTLADGLHYRLGTMRPQSAVRQMNSLRSRVNGQDLPEEFDARKKWENLIHPIQDQGQCGASWAFSTTGVASDRLSIHSKGHHVDLLSPQHLISCDTDILQLGCHGGHIDRAWWFIRVNGLVNSACYPYKSGKSGEKGSCLMVSYDDNCPHAGHEGKHFKATPPYRISSSEKDIMNEIMKNGPVQATMEVKEDFFMYKSGVYRYSWPQVAADKKQSGYHSVRIIGWGTDKDTGDKYWLCANSWGTQWGESGYFRIARGENESEIESFILAAWAKVTADGKSRIYSEKNNVFFPRRRFK